MKKLLYLFLLSSIAFSCNVFDVEPQASVSDKVAILDASGMRAAVSGLYDRIQTGYYNGRLFIAADINADIAQSVGTWDFYREMDTYRVSPDNNENRDLFTAIYQVVNQANNIIAAVTNIPDDTPADSTRSLGEAYFARGMAFFDAAMFWGGLPGVFGSQGIVLKLTPTQSIEFLPRSTLAETYAQIESDLLRAAELLPTTSANAGRLSRAAARALLARYYLYVKNYAKASEFASQVIAETRFQLQSDYTAIFTGKNTNESIFEVQFDNADQSVIRTWYLPGSIGGRGDLAVHEDFYNSIPATDDRKKLYAFDSRNNLFYPTKYSKAGNIDNIHVLRLAEMYLIRAEADYIVGKGDPLTDLNRIRTRAKLAPLPAISSIDDILNERKVEFAFEGQRWYDLLRTGKALTALSTVNRKNSPGVPAQLREAGRLVFPIPSVELNANPEMEQNEAYR